MGYPRRVSRWAMSKEYKIFGDRYGKRDPPRATLIKRSEGMGGRSHAVPLTRRKAAPRSAGQFSRKSERRREDVRSRPPSARDAVAKRCSPNRKKKKWSQVLTNLHQKPGQLGICAAVARPSSRASAASSPIGDMLVSPMAKGVLAGTRPGGQARHGRP